MKIKLIKNIYSLFNAVFIFIFLSLILLITMFYMLPEPFVLLPFLSIEIVVILTVFFLCKHLLTILIISDEKFVVRYLSKEVQTFKFGEFDDVEFTFTLFIRSPIIELYKSNADKPALTFHMSKKRLLILKKIVGFKPIVNEKIQSARYDFFGGGKTQ